MKTFNRILGLGAVASLVFGFASCSNDLNSPEVENPGAEAAPALKMLKTPDAIIWSGKDNLLNTFGQSKATDSETSTTAATAYLHNDEVEVNLSLLDEANSSKYTGGIADLVSKLSIHVRCATDVEIKLPIPLDYIIESDDLYIFHEHFGPNDDNGIYGSDDEGLTIEDGFKTLEFTVEGNPVKLSIKHQDNEIIIKTDGINEDVIAACFAKNEDGINFEIYNYYQTSVLNSEGKPVSNGRDRGDVQGKLNGATVKFLDDDPHYYINAFGWQMNPEADEYDEDGDRVSHGNNWNTGVKNPNDCTVEPAVLTGWTMKADMFHLNGTSFNVIYSKLPEGVNPDDAHAHGDGDGCVDGKHQPAVEPEEGGNE